MSRRYSPETKIAALERLHMCNGNIARASFETGIPERTLHTWRRQAWLEYQRRRPPTPPLPPLEDTPEQKRLEADFNALRSVRDQIMQEISNLAPSVTAGLELASPYHRVLILSQLLDRLLKLDSRIPPDVPSAWQGVLFAYQDSDGSIHTTPEHERDYDVEAWTADGFPDLEELF